MTFRYPSPARDKVVECYRRGLSMAETAEELGIAKGTVAMQRKIARKKGEIPPFDRKADLVRRTQ